MFKERRPDSPRSDRALARERLRRVAAQTESQSLVSSLDNPTVIAFAVGLLCAGPKVRGRVLRGVATWLMARVGLKL